MLRFSAKGQFERDDAASRVAVGDSEPVRVRVKLPESSAVMTASVLMFFILLPFCFCFPAVPRNEAQSGWEKYTHQHETVAADEMIPGLSRMNLADAGMDCHHRYREVWACIIGWQFFGERPAQRPSPGQ